MAKLTVHEQTYNDGEDAYVERAHEFLRLYDEVAAEALFMPTLVQRRIELARGALQDANDLVNYGFYYRTVRDIADSVAEHLTEVLTAVIREAPIPDHSKEMRHIAIALQKLDSQRNEEYSLEVHEYNDLERKWLAKNPEALPTPTANSRLTRLRRKVARAIAPE